MSVTWTLPYISIGRCYPCFEPIRSSGASTQGEGLFQQYQSGSAPPVGSQRPDGLSCAGRPLHHPGDLPALHWPEEQETQTLSGAQKLQRQLQHAGEHLVRDRSSERACGRARKRLKPVSLMAKATRLETVLFSHEFGPNRQNWKTNMIVENQVRFVQFL